MNSGNGSARKMTPIRSAVLDGLGKSKIPAPGKFAPDDEDPEDGDATGHGAIAIWNQITRK